MQSYLSRWVRYQQTSIGSMWENLEQVAGKLRVNQENSRKAYVNLVISHCSYLSDVHFPKTLLKRSYRVFSETSVFSRILPNFFSVFLIFPCFSDFPYIFSPIFQSGYRCKKKPHLIHPTLIDEIEKKLPEAIQRSQIQEGASVAVTSLTEFLKPWQLVGLVVKELNK